MPVADGERIVTPALVLTDAMRTLQQQHSTQGW
jgi:hypothetical protein